MSQENQNAEAQVQAKIFAISHPDLSKVTYTDDRWFADMARKLGAEVTELGMIPAQRLQRPAALEAAMNLFDQEVRNYIEQLESVAWPLAGLNVRNQVIEKQTISYDGGPLTIENSSFPGCNWQLTGPAALTLQLLSMLDSTQPEMLMRLFPNLVSMSRVAGVRDYNKQLITEAHALEAPVVEAPAAPEQLVTWAELADEQSALRPFDVAGLAPETVSSGAPTDEVEPDAPVDDLDHVGPQD